MAGRTRRSARAAIGAVLLVGVAACSSSNRKVGSDLVPNPAPTVPQDTTTLLPPASSSTSAVASTTSRATTTTALRATTTTIGPGPCTVTPKDHDGVSANVAQRNVDGVVVRIVVEAPLCIRPDRELYAEVHVINTTSKPLFFSTRMPGYVVVSDRTAPASLWSSPCLKDEQAPDQAFVVAAGEDQIVAHAESTSSPACGNLPTKAVLRAEGVVFRCTDSTCKTRAAVGSGPLVFETTP